MSHTSGQLRIWRRVHSWTSLACTLFLFMLCLTGLPLIFHEEIDDWLHPEAPYAAFPPDTPRVNLDDLVTAARKTYPGEIVISAFVDDDEPQVIISLAPSWSAIQADPRSGHFVKFDARTGQILERSQPPAAQERGLLDILLNLHRDLFAGLAGELFLALMAMLFITAIVSGVVLYGPFTRKLDFGEVRTRRALRTAWLDLHNFLGIVTIAWAMIVGLTGVMNELSNPLFAVWQRTEVAAAVSPWKDKSAPATSELSSIQAAFATAQRTLPGMTVISVVYPGGPIGSPYHYLLFTKGKSHLTSRLFSPVLIDARTGKLASVVRMPWYLRALELSRPLHFGDYGGLPLKIIWALLDVVTIVVLGSGLYLWIARPRRERAAAAYEGLQGANPEVGPAK